MVTLQEAVIIASLAAGAVLFGVSLYYQLVIEKPLYEKANEALDTGKEALKNAKDSGTTTAGAPGAPAEQSAVGDALKSTLEGMAAFAESLKGLDRSTRGYLISVVFFAIAMITAAVDVVAT